MNILNAGVFDFVGTNLSHVLTATEKHKLLALDISKPYAVLHPETSGFRMTLCPCHWYPSADGDGSLYK